MKHIFCCIFLIYIFPISTLAQSSLLVDLELAKKKFLKGEIIELGLSYSNKGNEVIKGNFGDAVSLTIKDQNGNSLPDKGFIPHFSPRKNIFNPGDEEYRLIELNLYYGENAITEGLFPEGDYTVEVYFEAEGLIPVHKSITFQVVNPEGDEEIVLNGILGIMNRKHTSSELLETFTSLHRKYPKSEYSPNLLTFLEGEYRVNIKNPQKADEIMRESIEKYPWTGRNRGYINSILEEMSTKSEKIEFLKKIKEGSKSFPMNKIIENKLQIEMVKE